MSYTAEYKQLLRNSRTISKSNIKPRNMYKIQTYSGSDPASTERYVFVIGIVDDNLHCLKLNEIPSKSFISFLHNIIDKRIDITENTILSDITKKYKSNGSDLFEKHIKNDSKIYSKQIQSYRVYKIDKIRTITQVFFEQGLLEEMFAKNKNETLRNVDVDEEIKEKDG